MKEIKPIQSDHPGEWHVQRFIEFAQAKTRIGEPMSHMRLVDYLSNGETVTEHLWRAGLYLNAWSVMSAEAIWNTWSAEAAHADWPGFDLWLRTNWAGVHTRKERRCVRTPDKFMAAIDSYANRWMPEEFPRLRALDLPNDAEYDAWWDSCTGIRYFGRYICTKMLETMRHWGYMKAQLYDLRAVGAHSPIRCLMLMQPDAVSSLSTGNPEVVNRIGSEIRDLVLASGTDISWFVYATLLCEYRVAYEDGSEYAGNSHDEELSYLETRYGRHWSDRGFSSGLIPARAAIDPAECLGELQGWKDLRPVGGWLRLHGVVWDDLRFDYHRSAAAGYPVARDAN